MQKSKKIIFSIVTVSVLLSALFFLSEWCAKKSIEAGFKIKRVNYKKQKANNFDYQKYPFLIRQNESRPEIFFERILYSNVQYIKKGYKDIQVGVPNFSGQLVGLSSRTKQVLYSAQLHTDSQGRRISSPLFAKSRERAQHFLILGCSYVWGEWMDDEQTLPWVLNQKQTTYESYNLGSSGGSLADILAKIDHAGLFEGVSQKPGQAVYVFIYDHLKRFVGSLRTVGHWGTVLPDYQEVSPFQFELKGVYAKTRPWYVAWSRWVSSLAMTEVLNIDYPILTKSDYERFARMMKVVESRYYSQFGANNRFTVVIYPDETWEMDYSELIEAFQKYNIQYLDYSAFLFWPFIDGPTTFEDYHPRPQTHSILADMLIQDLGLQ